MGVGANGLAPGSGVSAASSAAAIAFLKRQNSSSSLSAQAAAAALQRANSRDSLKSSSENVTAHDDRGRRDSLSRPSNNLQRSSSMSERTFRRTPSVESFQSRVSLQVDPSKIQQPAVVQHQMQRSLRQRGSKRLSSAEAAHLAAVNVTTHQQAMRQVSASSQQQQRNKQQRNYFPGGPVISTGTTNKNLRQPSLDGSLRSYDVDESVGSGQIPARVTNKPSILLAPPPARATLRSGPPSVISDVASDISGSDYGAALPMATKRKARVSFTDLAETQHADESAVVATEDELPKVPAISTPAASVSPVGTPPLNATYADGLALPPPITEPITHQTRGSPTRSTETSSPHRAAAGPLSAPQTIGSFIPSNIVSSRPELYVDSDEESVGSAEFEDASAENAVGPLATIQETEEFGHVDVYVPPKAEAREPDTAEMPTTDMADFDKAALSPPFRNDSPPKAQATSSQLTAAIIAAAGPSAPSPSAKSTRKPPLVTKTSNPSLTASPRPRRLSNSSSINEPMPQSLILARAIAQKMADSGMSVDGGGTELSDSGSESSFRRRKKERKTRAKEDDLGVGGFSSRRRAESISSQQNIAPLSDTAFPMRSADGQPPLRHARSRASSMRMSLRDPPSIPNLRGGRRSSFTTVRQNRFASAAEAEPSQGRFGHLFKRRGSQSSYQEDGPALPAHRSRFVDSDEEDEDLAMTPQTKRRFKLFRRKDKDSMSMIEPREQPPPMDLEAEIGRVEREGGLLRDRNFTKDRANRSNLGKHRRSKSAFSKSEVVSQRTGKPKKFGWLRRLFGIED